MRVKVKCFATLASYSPEEGSVDMPEGATVRDVVEVLGIPGDDVKIRFVNGQHVGDDAVLHSDDHLGLFPAVGGG